ncbi:hypothetical protein AQI88_26550 [Streptomyces cellostaticus]|uniref:PLAT domain-containing protein n=1 Tax=Streptomyces cellostaticus TaxID=67285 RepID=A0A101NHY9_9ACTN|nr:hypothetical protein [Streptomyces cellostaticus]KUM93344.1 hypothetical protein AQI88_26550 [Streptomyces cellostaticus]GHI02319.1 hypothetical protein Scel_06400 [Streptomyces cellostaticus]
MRRTLTAVGLTSTAVALGVLLAGPAAAASTTTQFDVTFPGKKPTTEYYGENSGTLKDGNMTAKSVMSWQILDDQVIDNSKRFTSFKITTRLEERLTKTTEDHVVTSKTCDLTKLVNDNYTWFQNEPVNTCAAPSAVYDGEVYWSADATIVYDIEGDGRGPITQQLTGSPLVHG